MDAPPISNPLPGNPLAATAARLQPVHLALACRILSAQGHDDFNQGQVSSCQRGAGHMLIKRAMTGFDGALPGDMIACPIDGGHPPPPDAPPELPLHQAIYAARSDVGGIVHTHAEYATVFGATDLPVRPLSHEGSYFADGVPRFTQTSQTVLDRATGDATARTLGARPAVFLCNHGAVLFRGFPVGSLEAFKAFVEAAGPPGAWIAYPPERATPRSTVQGFVMTSTEYHPQGSIYLHNECCHRRTWPLRLFFTCQRPYEDVLGWTDVELEERLTEPARLQKGVLIALRCGWSCPLGM